MTRGYKVGFAVSDTSLTQVISGRETVFDFELFRDTNFTNPYFNNDEDDGFQVVGVGTVRCNNNWQELIFLVTSNTPEDFIL